MHTKLAQTPNKTMNQKTVTGAQRTAGAVLENTQPFSKENGTCPSGKSTNSMNSANF